MLLLLRRFLLDHHLQVRGHVLVQLDGDGEFAHSLKRLVELDLPAIHLEAFLAPSASAMSPDVTEPKSWSCSPERRWNETETPSNCLASSSALGLLLGRTAHRRRLHLLDHRLIAGEASIASLRGNR